MTKYQSWFVSYQSSQCSGIFYVEVINDRWGQGFIKALNTNISAIPNEAVSIK